MVFEVPVEFVGGAFPVEVTLKTLNVFESLKSYRTVETSALQSGQDDCSCNQLIRQRKSNEACWHGCATACSDTRSRQITQQASSESVLMLVSLSRGMF